jgi:hypothetical protein
MEVDKIKDVVKFDLESTYSYYRGRYYFQKEGCPIGGILSSIYANISCAIDEFHWIIRNRDLYKTRMLCRRQIDDLIILIKRKKKEGDMEEEGGRRRDEDVVEEMGKEHGRSDIKDEESEGDEVESIIQRLMKIYTNGLEVERQEVWEDQEKIRAEFIGLNIRIFKSKEGEEGEVKIGVNNPNERWVRLGGRQNKPRLPHWNSGISSKMLINTLETMVLRVNGCSRGRGEYERGVETLKVEYGTIGYPKEWIDKQVWRVEKKWGRKEIDKTVVLYDDRERRRRKEKERSGYGGDKRE